MGIEHEHAFPKLTTEIEPLACGQSFQQPIVEVVTVYVNERLFHCSSKRQGAPAFRPKPPRRIGRASRVENNPSRGSACSLADWRMARKGVREKR